MINTPICYPLNCNYPIQNTVYTKPQPYQQPLPISQPYAAPIFYAPGYYPPIYTGTSILNKPGIMTEAPLQYTPEEQQYLKNHPNGDIMKFNVDNNNYKRAVEYFDKVNGQNNLQYLEKYLNNPSFDSLAKSKYFNEDNNFHKLINIVCNLSKTQTDAYQKISSPNYYSQYIPDKDRMLANIDVNNCIKNLDNFFKTDKVSEDLKKYLLYATNKFSDLWFVHMNLGNKDLDVNKLIFPYAIL